MSSRGCRSNTAAAHARIESDEARSIATNSTASPSFSASRATAAPFSRSMSAPITRAPACANANTVARPIPDEPPVISATFPASSINYLLSCQPARTIERGFCHDLPSVESSPDGSGRAQHETLNLARRTTVSPRPPGFNASRIEDCSRLLGIRRRAHGRSGRRRSCWDSSARFSIGVSLRTPLARKLDDTAGSLKLGFAVAQSTVANGMDRPCFRP